jgi:hypothetical protein
LIRFTRAVMSNILLFLTLASLACDCLPAIASQRHETITGRIIAYSKPLECLNGNAYWSMIVRVVETKHASRLFVRVNFSLPCEKSPAWPSAKSTTQKFRLIRDKGSDQILVEFMDSIHASTEQEAQRLPLWTLVSGAEQEKLPFGKIVPSYLSVDLPLAPLL